MIAVGMFFSSVVFTSRLLDEIKIQRHAVAGEGGAFCIIGARKLTSEFFQKVFTRMANGRLSIFSLVAAASAILPEWP